MQPNFERYLSEEKELKQTRNYIVPLKYLEDFAHADLLSITDHRKIRQLVIDCSKARGHSERMRYKIAKCLEIYYRWAEREGIISKCPFKSEFRKGPAKEPYFVSEDDFEKVLYGQCLTIRDFVMLKMLWDSGVRRAELANLNCEDIDIKNQTIHVKEGKGGKPRYTAFSVDLIPMLQVLMEQAKRSLKQKEMFGHPLFLTESGHRLDKCTITKHIMRLGQKVGVHLYPHALRHSLAGRIISNGGDGLFVQRLLGHSSMSMTNLYTHLSKDQITKLYSKHAKSA